MKQKIIEVGLIWFCAAVFGLIISAYGGEHEELVLKQQLLQEKMMKCQAQAQLLQQEFQGAQTELQAVNEKLKPSEPLKLTPDQKPDQGTQNEPKETSERQESPASGKVTSEQKPESGQETK